MRVTLQELSERHKANKPALYARLKKLQELNPDKELSNKVGNVLYLTEDGLSLLETDLKENPVNTKAKEARGKRAKRQNGKTDTETSSSEELIDSLKSEIGLLTKQLEEKDKTIERLLSVIESLNQNYSNSLTESHSLMSQQQTIQAIELSQPEETRQPRAKRKSFLSKLVVAGKLFRGDFD